MSKVRLSDIAKKAGVSVTTVSRSMNGSGYVAEEVQVRINQAAVALGYVHPEHKKKTTRKNTIGVISSFGTLNPFTPALSATLQLRAASMDYYCIQSAPGYLDNEKLAFHAEQLSKLNVCGLLVATFLAETLNEETRTLLHSLDIPIVFLERADGCYGFNRVLVDSVIGTYSATKHLLNNGHRHLAYITHSRITSVESSKTEGFRRAIEESDNPNIKYTITACDDVNPLSAANAMRYALAQDPAISGVVAWNDLLALGAQPILQSATDKAEIIGYDNLLAPFLSTPISSVEMPIDEIATSAIEIIDKHVTAKTPPSPRTITLEPKLVLIG